MNIQKLLVTTDLSEASKCALDAANSLAKQFGASVTLLTALDFEGEFPPGVLSLSPEKDKALREELRGKVREQLEALKGSHFDDEVRVETALVEGGGAAAAITDYAEKNPQDLLVIATHGRTGVGRLLLGSVAERVVRTAPCPVLTIRPS
ncbi:MAG: universal stress protein [Myxococcales bacterium]|nr:universal stress protein [Myxococcales bacterium]